MTRHSCGSKVRYADVPEAMAALDLAQKTWRVPPVRWYRCTGHASCGGYHLTLHPYNPGRRPDDPTRVAARTSAEKLKQAARDANPFSVLANLADGGTVPTERRTA